MITAHRPCPCNARTYFHTTCSQNQGFVASLAPSRILPE
jgi:hypothetical protein